MTDSSPHSPAASAAHDPAASAAHRRLNPFIGVWTASGESYAAGQRADDPRASAVPWTSDETYEWLPGGFFVLHRWDAMAGRKVFKGTEIIGHDPALGGYFTRFFDNDGFHPEYRVDVSGNAWTFREPATRATITFSDGDDRMNVSWEWKNHGAEWLPLCDRVATRIA
jgi:hypothetical protein